ncbi:hypothetical protein HDU89_003465 [Geranomyces variabilis]|nr:hypothetical protein HDU89_003465 [Geranomyces variabilis]
MLPAPSYTRTDNNSNNSPAAAMKPTTVFHYTHSPHRHALAHPLVASILADPAAVWACDASWVEGVRGVLGEGWNRWVGRQTEGGIEGREEVVVIEQNGGDFYTSDEREQESEYEQEEEQEEEEVQRQPPADLNDKKPKAVAAADSAATLNPTTQMALAADEQEVAAAQPDDPRLLRRRSSLHVLLDRAANLAHIKGRVRRAFVTTNRRRGSRGDGDEQRDTAAANTATRDFLGTTATATAGAFYFPGF